LYGAFVWARRSLTRLACNSPKRRCPTKADPLATLSAARRFPQAAWVFISARGSGGHKSALTHITHAHFSALTRARRSSRSFSRAAMRSRRMFDISSSFWPASGRGQTVSAGSARRARQDKTAYSLTLAEPLHWRARGRAARPRTWPRSRLRSQTGLPNSMSLESVLSVLLILFDPFFGDESPSS
jgi:hypothetical protein